MTRQEFWEWMATCPARQDGKDSGWIVSDDGGFDMNIFFYFEEALEQSNIDAVSLALKAQGKDD